MSLVEVIARSGVGALESKRALLRALGGEIARLHRAGFIHGDLTPHNIFVGGGVRPRFIFIDHDRTRRAAALGRRRRQLRNLVQLGRFDLEGVTRTDRLRVFRAWADALKIAERSLDDAAGAENACGAPGRNRASAGKRSRARPSNLRPDALG